MSKIDPLSTAFAIVHTDKAVRQLETKIDEALGDVREIEGRKGDRGDRGPQGARGEKGEKGDAGATGEKGADGTEGKRGDGGETGLAQLHFLVVVARFRRVAAQGAPDAVRWGAKAQRAQTDKQDMRCRSSNGKHGFTKPGVAGSSPADGSPPLRGLGKLM